MEPDRHSSTVPLTHVNSGLLKERNFFSEILSLSCFVKVLSPPLHLKQLIAFKRFCKHRGHVTQ